MKTSNTKKRFLLSLVAVVACVAMLIGTTFAWFTDSVSNTGNKIQAGTLKVGLKQYKKVGEAEPNWVDISGDETPVFNYGLWEPGYSQYAALKLTNEGNLAFMYKMLLTVNGTLELNENGHSLADAIDVYGFTTTDVSKAIEACGKSSFADFTAITDVEKLGTLSSFLFDEDGAAYGVLLPNGATATEGTTEVVGSAYAVLCLHMQEEAGNEYQGMALGTSFDVVVNATQYTYEKDGFNSKDYDYLADGNPDHPEFNVPTYPVTKLPIKTVVEEGGTTEVTQQQTIELPSGMKIEYPAGVPLTTTPTTGTPGESTNKADQGFEFISDKPAAGSTNVIGLLESDSNKAVAQYKLTLPVDSSKNDAAIVNSKLVKTIDKIAPYYVNLRVFHNNTEIVKVGTPDAEPTVESFYYNPETGDFTLWVFHSSPIEFVYDVIDNAISVSTKEELEQAINDAEDNKETTIRLMGDIDISYETTENFQVITCFNVPVSKNIVLDFNGHYIKATKSENIKIDPRVCIFRIVEGATISFISTASEKGLLQTDLSWEMIANNGTVPTIDNMEIKSTETTTAGKGTGTDNGWSSLIWNYKTGQIEQISNSNIGLDGEGTDEVDVITNYGSIGEISNSKVYCKQESALTYKYAVTNIGTITKIANSELSIESQVGSETHQQNFTLYNSGTIDELDSVTINGLMTAISNGGKINKFESPYNVVIGEVAGGGTYNIKAGTFSKQLLQTYLAPEYMCKLGEDGKYHVEYDKDTYDSLPKAAAIGDTEYLNFAQAYAAATSDQTIKLLADVSEQLLINKSITLDLNGHNIVPTNADKSYAVRVNNGHVVITDSTDNPGSIGTADNHNWWYTLMVGGLNSDLTIEKISIYDGATDGVYLIGGTNNAKVDFTSGTIYANNSNTAGISIGATNGVFNMSGTAKVEVASGKTGVKVNIGDYGKTTPTFNMNGGTIRATGSGNCIVNQSVDYGKFNLKDATITAASGTALNVGGVTIDHCTITSNSSALSLKHDGYDRAYNNCTVNIKGGSSVTGSIYAQNESKWTISLENGTYNNSGKNKAWFEKYVDTGKFDINCTGTTACTVTAK